MANRFPEVDIARGCAIVLMIVSNLVTDLQFFYNYSGNETFWWLFARATATVFIFLVGVSLVLSHKKRDLEAGVSGPAFFHNFTHYLKRGAYVFCLGLLLTAITYFLIPNDFIRFGVLHLIGISIMIGFLFLKMNKYFSFIIGIFLILMGFLITNITATTDNLFFLGLITKTFSSVDYFPIFPWLGVVLLGIFAGKVLYAQHKPLFDLKQTFFTSLFSWLGRNSLVIYLVHQPVLLTVLFLYNRILI